MPTQRMHDIAYEKIIERQKAAGWARVEWETIRPFIVRIKEIIAKLEADYSTTDELKHIFKRCRDYIAMLLRESLTSNYAIYLWILEDFNNVSSPLYELIEDNVNLRNLTSEIYYLIQLLKSDAMYTWRTS